jgi:hypothetical protein
VLSCDLTPSTMPLRVWPCGAVCMSTAQVFAQFNTNATRSLPFYMHDLKRLIEDRGNHPSIIQWMLFNEVRTCHFAPPHIPSPHCTAGAGRSRGRDLLPFLCIVRLY